VAFGRSVAEAHMRASLYAGIRVSGINGEVLPGQVRTSLAGIGLVFPRC
jgi:hypothetical protein